MNDIIRNTRIDQKGTPISDNHNNIVVMFDCRENLGENSHKLSFDFPQIFLNQTDRKR